MNIFFLFLREYGEIREKEQHFLKEKKAPYLGLWIFVHFYSRLLAVFFFLVWS